MKPTTDQIRAHLESLSPRERAEVLTKATLKLPRTPAGAEPLGPRDPSQPDRGRRAQPPTPNTRSPNPIVKLGRLA
jgi:hypothetical protein